MTAIEKQIAHLARDIEQRRQRLKDLEQKQKNAARTEDARRKIIYGAAFLKRVEDNPPKEQDRILKWIHRYVTNKRDREFLGLPPLPEPKGNQ